MIDVSIVIVCMNNLKNLYPCLNSIKNYTTTIKYETFVVAYLFTPENLTKVKSDFPWITIIESNEIRGFSENNNLALRQAKGKYCFVVNDDTCWNSFVINDLFNTIEKSDDSVAVMSPLTLNKDGSVQRNGRPKYSLWSVLLTYLKLNRKIESYSKYINKEGIYQSYNISGAAFLIKTNVFRNVGWFDERYFFCPEDVALSTCLNRKGYKCMVNSDIQLTHLCGGTWSKLQSATMPASVKGEYIMYSTTLYSRIIFILVSAPFLFFYGLCWFIINIVKKTDKAQTKYHAYFNSLMVLFSSKSPKDIFIKYYKTIKAK